MSADRQQKTMEWRAEMETNLRANYSWLSLAGLFWLEAGSNQIGSGKDCTVRLPERFPARVGTIRFADGKAHVSDSGDGHVRVNIPGAITSEIALHADITGKPDFVYVDDLRMMLMERAGQAAIRLCDPQSNIRKSFTGRKWFDYDIKFVVEADITNYEPVKTVMVEDILGFQHAGRIDAHLEFSIGGRKMELDAELLESGAYNVIFSDGTAGKDSYNTGRYMVTEVSSEWKVIIDFNRAYSPPCAFTNFATCPLPRPENITGININAGELFISENNNESSH